MTERELAEIEARVQAELAAGGWAGDPDVVHDLLRDEIPRLVGEIRRLQAQIQIYRDGIAELETSVADEILHRALQAGRKRPTREPAVRPSEEALLGALEKELGLEVAVRRK